jgi:uncharacterized membrane protein
MLVLLVLLIAVMAGLLFGAGATSFTLVVAGAAVAIVFALGAFITAKRPARRSRVPSGAARS